MKKTMLKAIFCIIVAAVFLVSFSGCDWLADLFASSLIPPDGYVKNCKAEGTPGISGVTVTLTPIEEGVLDTAGAITATSLSNGFYSFSELSYGEYELSAALTGYVFIPQKVEVAGIDQNLPVLLGYEANAADVISVILVWEDETRDLDAYMTYPLDSSGAGTAGTFDPYADLTPFELNRGRVYYSTPKSNPVGIVLDVDVNDTNIGTVAPVETISFQADTASNPVDVSDLPGSSKTWDGVYVYYINGWSDDVVSEQGTPISAGAKVYVMSGINCVGVYEIPTYTDIDSYEVLRIHSFNDTYRIYFSGRILDSTSDFKAVTLPEYVEIKK